MDEKEIRIRHYKWTPCPSCGSTNTSINQVNDITGLWNEFECWDCRYVRQILAKEEAI